MAEIRKPLRVGVVGLGVGRHHLLSYLKIPGVEVVAAADANPERLQEVGAANGVPYLYADYRPLVDRNDLDIVNVCTPNSLHAPVTIAALESGKHVLCEKPLASTLADAEQMVATSERTGRALAVTFNHRERGDVQTLKRLIDEGRLGRIYHAKAWWLRRNGIPGLGSWFTKKNLAGGGPLIDLGVHMLDMALFLMGEPCALAVSGAAYAELGPRGRGGNPWAKKQPSGDVAYDVEDLASAFIRLDGNATLLLETSWATYRADNDEYGITLYGTEGGAEIRVVNYVQEDTLKVFVDLAGTPVDVHPHPGKGEGHLASIRAFVECLRGGDWRDCHGREGLARTRIIDACYRSAEIGREIVL
ncbi:MAG: Gfo/Idh/MocA family oxidoreductase [Anaerolineae bacterium]|nr:Gfo/Idh/MocA family oxidoreductase [Anaerolineae bacterium]